MSKARKSRTNSIITTQQAAPEQPEVSPSMLLVNSSHTTADAWKELVSRLAIALSGLEEDDFLILAIKQSNAFVQFSAQGSFGMRVEATSNTFLTDREELTSEAQERLFACGWQTPTYVKKRDEKEPPDGSCNYYIDLDMPLSFGPIAALAATTLRDIYGARYPGELSYKSFSRDGTQLRHPILGLKREK